MYNLAVTGEKISVNDIQKLFGNKYDLTDDLSQANVLVITDHAKAEIPDSKLLFAILDLTDEGLPESAASYCLERGIAVFNIADSIKQGRDPLAVSDISIAAAAVCDFIENGNLAGSGDFPEISLGPFGGDACRIIIMMKGIDDPILLSAMMFSGMDVRAVAGGLSGDYGLALAALREPVTRIPHLDGVLKVRVLQDI